MSCPSYKALGSAPLDEAGAPERTPAEWRPANTASDTRVGQLCSASTRCHHTLRRAATLRRLRNVGFRLRNVSFACRRSTAATNSINSPGTSPSPWSSPPPCPEPPSTCVSAAARLYHLRGPVVPRRQPPRSSPPPLASGYHGFGKQPRWETAPGSSLVVAGIAHVASAASAAAA
jgi:hypothetical protein